MDSAQIILSRLKTIDNSEAKWRTTCVKCGKHGRSFLVCQNNGCPIVVHRSCMACPARFDSAGNFNCPYCLHKQALEEYTIARNNALLARGALFMFSDGAAGENKDCDDEPEVEGVKRMTQKQERNKTLIVGDEPTWMEHDECNNLGDVGMKESSPASLVTVKAKTASTDCIEENGKMTQCDSGIIISSAHNQKPTDTEKRVNMCSKVEGNKPPHAVTEVGNIGAASKKIVSDDCLQEDGLRNMGNAGLDEDASLAFDLFPKNQEIKQASEERQDLEEMVSLSSQSEMVSKGESHIQKPSSKEDPGGMKQFEFEDNDLEFCNMEVAKVPTERGMQTFCSSICGRRKKLRWTPEEEEMLKEAVVMFSSKPRKNLPWRKMIDYGHNVFDRTRTPSDLKDKWKLILKRASMEIRRGAKTPK